MEVYNEEFPFNELKNQHGDYYGTISEAVLDGFNLNQIWSVTEGDEQTYIYGPHNHFVNLIGYVCTLEKHNMNTYYVETLDFS